jgi:hypothetical protein
MTGERISSGQLVGLQGRLEDHDLAIVRGVNELRLMTAAHISALHFGPERHESPGAASRACRRCLAQLSAERLLVRAGRRVGGVRAGSSGFIYALGPVGQRLIELDGPRRRFREPSATFADHTLAVSQLVVDLTIAARAGRCELLGFEGEPTCWRAAGGASGRQILRPDLFVSLGVGPYEHRFFIEMDRGNEHLPALIRKCRLYDAYYQSGREQASFGVFPRVCWIMPTAERVERLRQAIEHDRRLTSGLFLALTNTQAVAGLVGETA